MRLLRAPRVQYPSIDPENRSAAGSNVQEITLDIYRCLKVPNALTISVGARLNNVPNNHSNMERDVHMVVHNSGALSDGLLCGDVHERVSNQRDGWGICH